MLSTHALRFTAIKEIDPHGAIADLVCGVHLKHAVGFSIPAFWLIKNPPHLDMVAPGDCGQLVRLPASR